MPLLHPITPKLKIHVYADEHAPTHFHVCTPNGEAEIWLDDLVVKENSGVSAAALKRAKAWADDHREAIRALFNKLNPEIAK